MVGDKMLLPPVQASIVPDSSGMRPPTRGVGGTYAVVALGVFVHTGQVETGGERGRVKVVCVVVTVTGGLWKRLPPGEPPLDGGFTTNLGSDPDWLWLLDILFCVIREAYKMVFDLLRLRIVRKFVNFVVCLSLFLVPNFESCFYWK